MNNEKNSIVQGAFWKFAERISAQIVSFVVSIILARILSPDEYGSISIVMVFITIANVFVSSGLGQALIQKKDADTKDFSSVFYFSLALTSVLYMVLFFIAPFISHFYEMPILSPVLRVLSISVPILGINSVQQAYVSRKMAFKKFFWATLIGTIISAFVGIWMAYNGYGIWALVAQSLTNNVIDTIILQLLIDWKLTLEFSFGRIKNLLNYGWKLLVQGLIVQLYGNLSNLLIGKYYSSASLSFYTKGKQFPDLICNNVDTAVNTALFPAMSKEQNSVLQVKYLARKTTEVSTFLMSPLLLWFIVCGDKIIRILLTEKWIECVPYLRIGCVILLFRPLQTPILQGIKAIGRSDYVLKIDIPIRIFALMVLLISLRYSVLIFAVSEILVTILGTIIYSIGAKKMLNYYWGEMYTDFLKYILISIVSWIPSWFVGCYFKMGDVWELVLQSSVGALLYFALTAVTKSKAITYVFGPLMKLFKKKED